MEKKKIIVGLVSFMTLGLAFCAASQELSSLRTNASARWKHFAATMPTLSNPGVREYWTACDGSDPVFADPGVSSTDSTLTQEQLAAITSNRFDERFIPSLNDIQQAIDAKKTGLNAYDIYTINTALAYKYLDDTTLASITGDLAFVDASKESYDSNFEVIWDAGKDALPSYGGSEIESVTRTLDSTYGNVIAIKTGEVPATKSFESYFYNWGNKTYGESDLLHIAIKSPFPSASGTSQTYFFDAYSTSTKYNATPSNWTEIIDTGSKLNSNGKFATSLGGAISLQRYNNKQYNEPFQGTYLFASIIAEKNKIEDGSVVLSSLNPFVDKKTWGNDNAVITQGVDSPYGPVNKVEIANKTTVFEAQWNGLSLSKVANFKYIVCYVYAEVNCALYFSQTSWRNSVLNTLVDSTADNNGSIADADTSRLKTHVGWNTIVIDSSKFKTNNLYVEFWNTTSGNETWLVSSLFGYNDLNNIGMTVAPRVGGSYSSTASISRVENSSYGNNEFKVTFTSYPYSTEAGNGDNRVDLLLPRLNLTEYSSIKIAVKAPINGHFGGYYDGSTDKWWPFGESFGGALSKDTYVEYTANTSSIVDGCDIANLRLGLLFYSTEEIMSGDWYVAVQFIK